jgi:hypothetical protein
MDIGPIKRIGDRPAKPLIIPREEPIIRPERSPKPIIQPVKVPEKVK